MYETPIHLFSLYYRKSLTPRKGFRRAVEKALLEYNHHYNFPASVIVIREKGRLKAFSATFALWSPADLPALKKNLAVDFVFFSMSSALLDFF